MSNNVIGLDIAEHIFHLSTQGADGKMIKKPSRKRIAHHLLTPIRFSTQDVLKKEKRIFRDFDSSNKSPHTTAAAFKIKKHDSPQEVFVGSAGSPLHA